MAFYEAAGGSGPRMVVCHPKLPIIYVLNELSASISVLFWDKKQMRLELIQNMNTLDKPLKSNLAAGLILSPDGRHLYSTNRGEDTVVAYELDEKGMPRQIQKILTEGRTPRGICISGNGKWILVGNQESDFVIQYYRDPETGLLRGHARIPVPTPVSITMVKKK